MQLTFPSWADYKATVVTKKALRLQYGEGANTYDIVAVEGSVEWVYSILKDEGAEQDDFEDHYKDDANQPVELRTAAGADVATVLNYPEDCQDLRKSWLVDAAPETLAIRDLWVGGDLVGAAGECWLAAGAYEVWSAAERGSYLEFAIVDRDDVTGAFVPYGLVRSKLAGLTDVVGTFQVGETVVGGTSGARTTVLAVDTDELEVRFAVFDEDGEDAEFSDGETITGETSEATATLDTPAFTEGDVLYLRKPFLMDEVIKQSGSDPSPPVLIQPGGARMVPGGLYFRVSVWNAAASGDLTIKASLIMGTR
jgi:hypothetical protein